MSSTKSDNWGDRPAVPLPLAGPGQVPCCDQCKRQGSTETLKRCGGCSTMLYCSKECQKAAWTSHKTLCRRPRGNANPSPINVAKMVGDWILVHTETFEALLNTTVYLGGGVAHALSEPRGIVCRLNMRNDWNGNPAAPFHLVSFLLEHRDEAEILGDQWDGLMESRKKAEGPFKVAETPEIAGIIPIVFSIRDNGSNFVVNNYFPVNHTRLADDTALDPRTRVALFGLNVHCKRCLDGGLVYHTVKKPGGDGMGMDLGRYGKKGKKGKKWKWEMRTPGDPEFMEMRLQNTALTGGMTVPETWKVYNEL
ncbi:hypothetical protein OH76DRAFT_127086 [Lentinus brumalis]|uniref:MYND-type domain-containing protein n=1 Tax=Lentinus brumalis TaxID=2498619 RepID=A0A371DJX5_9APHY|nr:hypothetical protein OH76DRAFT_127086 [Polyporus brumalis]